MLTFGTPKRNRSAALTAIERQFAATAPRTSLVLSRISDRYRLLHQLKSLPDLFGKLLGADIEYVKIARFDKLFADGLVFQNARQRRVDLIDYLARCLCSHRGSQPRGRID